MPLFKSETQIDKNGKQYQPVDTMNLLLKVSATSTTSAASTTSLFHIWMSCDRAIFADLQAMEAKCPGYEVDMLVKIKLIVNC